MHSTCSEKVIGNVSRLHAGSLSTPSCLVSVRAVPGLPTLFHLSRQFCVESEPRIPMFGSMHDFTSPFLHCDLATCCRRGLEGPTFFQSVILLLIYTTILSLLIILTESWDGPWYLAQGLEGVVSVSLLSSFLLMKPRQHLPSPRGLEERSGHTGVLGRSNGVCILTTAFFWLGFGTLYMAGGWRSVFGLGHAALA